MSKHTPGPWNCWSGYNAADDLEDQITADDGDVVIANYNNLIDQGEANAHLIAAAPDLLASLSNLVGLARTGAARLDKYHAALADADKAIAKAKG